MTYFNQSTMPNSLLNKLIIHKLIFYNEIIDIIFVVEKVTKIYKNTFLSPG